MQQVELEIVNQWFAQNLEGWTVNVGSPRIVTWYSQGLPEEKVGNLKVQAYTNPVAEFSQEVNLPNYATEIKLEWWQGAYSSSSAPGGLGVLFYDSNKDILLDVPFDIKITLPSIYTKREMILDVPLTATTMKIVFRGENSSGNNDFLVAGVKGTATIIEPPTEDTERKFTPYGLTALPPKAERDPNGVYFIRTATGFELVTINKTTRDPVRMDMVSYPTGNPHDINLLKVGLASVWTPQDLRMSMFNLFACVTVGVLNFNGVDTVRSNLQTSFIVQAGNNPTISIPDANQVKGHVVRIVAGKAGGLQGVSINKSYKFFDGSTIPGTSLAGDYMVLLSNGSHWYMIGGN